MRDKNLFKSSPVDSRPRANSLALARSEEVHATGGSSQSPSSPRPRRIRNLFRADDSLLQVLPRLTHRQQRDSSEAVDMECPHEDLLRSLAEGRQWHIVNLLDANELPTDEWQPPAQTEAIVLVLTECRIRPALGFVERVRALNATQSTPLVAVFMLPGGKACDTVASSVLYAQRALCARGADGAVLGVGSAANVRLAVDMCLADLEQRNASKDDYEEQVHAHFQRQLNEELREQQSQLEAAWSTHDALFWEIADQLFGHIPKLCWDLVDEPHEGGQIGDMALGNILGKGSFGVVFKCAGPDAEEPGALKVLAKSQLCTLKSINSLNMEIGALKLLDHPNVVRFRGVMHGQRYIFILMEQAGSTNLLKWVKGVGGTLQQEPAKRFFKQLAAALRHCHGRGIAHRDVKPENIAVDDDGQELKLLDFGGAVRTGKRSFHPTGTMPFTAPEVIAIDRESGYDPAACDIWSCAVVLMEMLCGAGILNKMLGWPYMLKPERRHAAQLVACFGGGTAPLSEALEPEVGAVPESLLELLSGAFEVNAEQRWTAGQLEESAWSQPLCQPAPRQPLDLEKATLMPTKPSAPRPKGRPVVTSRSACHKAPAPKGDQQPESSANAEDAMVPTPCQSRPHRRQLSV